uniref:G-protein coupled receptors family 1 profile domain-containing protein n=1 Tax=Plectus sambesii TaxID=2011161 RepID=A0A914X111_9BILA
MLLPACLAVCRYATICHNDELSGYLRILKTRKGIFALNAICWLYGACFTLPFSIEDKFGLDGVGTCGIAEIDSTFLWTYYMVGVVIALFAAYAVTYIFYYKLAQWIKDSETSALMMTTRLAHDKLTTTRNLMRMMKWILLIPVVLYYPALTVEAVLRIYPGAMTMRTARYFTFTVPLPKIINPIITIIFVKRYRAAVCKLFHRNVQVSNGDAASIATTCSAVATEK